MIYFEMFGFIHVLKLFPVLAANPSSFSWFTAPENVRLKGFMVVHEFLLYFDPPVMQLISQ